MKKTVGMIACLIAGIALGVSVTVLAVNHNKPDGYDNCIQTVKGHDGEGFCAVYNTPYGWQTEYDTDDGDR